MKTKQDRLDYIREVLTSRDVHNQDELMQILSSKGYVSTQATLSRDLRQLRAIRAANQFGEISYLLPSNPNYVHVSAKKPRSETAVANALLGVEDAGAMLVLRVLPGFANVMGVTIDNAHCASVAGTIAGDDTLLVIGKKGFEREDIIEELGKVVPQIKLD